MPPASSLLVSAYVRFAIIPSPTDDSAIRHERACFRAPATLRLIINPRPQSRSISGSVFVGASAIIPRMKVSIRTHSCSVKSFGAVTITG